MLSAVTNKIKKTLINKEIANHPVLAQALQNLDKVNRIQGNNVAINFNQALGIHEQALHVRTARAELIANNLANSDTPNFKARDIDFRQALRTAQQDSSIEGKLNLQTTNNRHHTLSDVMGFNEGGEFESLFRVPMQTSIDGNTVDEHVEHAEFMENTLAYQASFTFLNSKFKGINSAIRGE
ncbi:flagellar basal body rod protein FlgB [Aurantivibrio infirmus]